MKVGAYLLCALIGAIGVGDVYAHGGGHRRNPPPPPPPPPDPPPFYGPNSGVPPGSRTPTDPPDTGGPETPPDPAPPAPEETTPPDNGPPPPPQEHTPPPSGPMPAGPPVGGPQTKKPGAGRGTKGATTPTSWRVWWEFNREYVLGLRGLLRENRAVVSGGGAVRGDPFRPHRATIRRALRGILVEKRNDPQLRGSAAIALGRVGTDKDADFLLEPLRSRKESPHAATAAALGLGILPPFRDDTVRTRVRDQLDRIVTTRDQRDRNVRGFVIVAAGLRAHGDKSYVIRLANYSASYARDSYDVTALVYACGISRDPVLLAELMMAARRGALGERDLDDNARSHAVFGLGLQRSPVALNLLRRILKSRRSGVQTRRAAALSLGRLLREAELEPAHVDMVRRALVAALDKDRDAILRSYCAIALAGARKPLEVDRLMKLAGSTGGPTLRTYAAVSLGIAARAMENDQRIRKFLLRELGKARDIEYASAVSVALGLAGAVEATEDLIVRVENRRLPAPVRGAAAEALGLLRQPHARTAKVLIAALRDGPVELVEGAALGLGLLGRNGTTKQLVRRLEASKSGILQGRLTLALAHLGQAEAVEPLLELLQDRRKPRVVRELAAVALGILADPREEDVLFDLDAYYNYFATTVLTHELLTIF